MEVTLAKEQNQRKGYTLWVRSKEYNLEYVTGIWRRKVFLGDRTLNLSLRSWNYFHVIGVLCELEETQLDVCGNNAHTNVRNVIMSSL